MQSQKLKFNIEPGVSYLNCANIAPLMTSLKEEGVNALERRQQPYKIQRQDWFEPVDEVKRQFAQLIKCPDPDRIALIPSVSYGMATVARNIGLKPGDELVLLEEQYPSNYYSWQALAAETGAGIVTVKAPESFENKGEAWNEAILNAINERTKVVALGQVHWTDGTRFGLVQIGERARAVGAKLIIDGSQSVGALPFNIQEIRPDALFCVGYKWLLGPFSLGLAYFGEAFDNGSPLEENWINREGSDDFQNLVNYTPDYRPKAGRYSVGENSNFHLLPILKGALVQLNEWGVANIQDYCQQLTAIPINELTQLGCIVEKQESRAAHLFGIRFRKEVDLSRLNALFVENQIYVSLRGTAVRVSVNVFNDQNDMDKLVETIKRVL